MRAGHFGMSEQILGYEEGQPACETFEVIMMDPRFAAKPASDPPQQRLSDFGSPSVHPQPTTASEAMLPAIGTLARVAAKRKRPFPLKVSLGLVATDRAPPHQPHSLAQEADQSGMQHPEVRPAQHRGHPHHAAASVTNSVTPAATQQSYLAKMVPDGQPTAIAKRARIDQSSGAPGPYQEQSSAAHAGSAPRQKPSAHEEGEGSKQGSSIELRKSIYKQTISNSGQLGAADKSAVEEYRGQHRNQVAAPTEASGNAGKRPTVTSTVAHYTAPDSGSSFTGLATLPALGNQTALQPGVPLIPSMFARPVIAPSLNQPPPFPLLPPSLSAVMLRLWHTQPPAELSQQTVVPAQQQPNTLMRGGQLLQGAPAMPPQRLPSGVSVLLNGQLFQAPGQQSSAQSSVAPPKLAQAGTYSLSQPAMAQGTPVHPSLMQQQAQPGRLTGRLSMGFGAALPSQSVRGTHGLVRRRFPPEASPYELPQQPGSTSNAVNTEQLFQGTPQHTGDTLVTAKVSYILRRSISVLRVVPSGECIIL